MGQVPDDLKEIVAVEAEVDALRDRTQRIVAELERRLRARAAQAKHTVERVRHMADVRAQLEEHPRTLLSVSTLAAVTLGLGVYVAIARRRAARRPMARLRGGVARVRGYLAAASGGVKVRRRESIGRRVLAAVLVAGATTLVRGLGMLVLARAVPPAERRALPPGRARH